MVAVRTAADQFLACRRIAVTGVSRNPQNHGANVVYRRFKERGYDVVPINPNAPTVEGDTAYPTLKAVPGGVEAVVIGTRPERALDTVRECVDLGVEQVWMHRGPGAGSVSPEAVAFGREHGLTVIDGGCPCMFGATADTGHKIFKLFLGRKVPRQV